MTRTIDVPLWLFALLCAIGVAAAVSWLLVPALRWYFRRQSRGVLDEISLRLNIELPQFKLTRRRALIDRLMSDLRVLAAAEAHAATAGIPRAQVTAQIARYAREIVPAFNAYVYFRIGYWLAKNFARLGYRVRLGYTDANSLTAINPKSTVVFVMNHRSNMDYILVSFLAAERVALSYARTLLRKLDAAPAPAGLARTLAITGGYLVRQAVFTLTGKGYRYGYACVNFGQPVSVREHLAQPAIDFRVMDDGTRHGAVAEVGERLMDSIGAIVPVLPVPLVALVALVASVFMRDPRRALSELELKAEVLALIERVESRGAHVHVPRTDRDYALTVGLRMLTLRHLIVERDGLFTANFDELKILAYYANSIAHLSAQTSD